MTGGSLKRACVVILVSCLGVLPLGRDASGQVSSGSSEAAREESPAARVFGSLFAIWAAPYTVLFSDLRTSYLPGKKSILGMRLEHRFRTVGIPDKRMHPYLSVGLRFASEERESTWLGREDVTTQAAIEAALGYQWALAPVAGAIASWEPPIVLATEIQWFPFRETDRVRAEVAPGVSLRLSSDQRLRLHFTASFSLRGMGGQGLRTGGGVVYNWK